uniref:Uncharacterized protein n=1 Tax=Caenorhabditis tropicalis TaxID=1561998 RepID=A0A1I7T177_9PELO
MRVQFYLISLIFICFVSTETVFKVRKILRRSENRRSAADDDLDMAAAELVFKEKNTLKSGFDRIEGPPRKLPFGTEHAPNDEKLPEHTGAPSAEPTFSELQKTHLEENDKTETGTLKSSMVGEGSENLNEKEEIFPSEAPKFHSLTENTFSEGINDGETSVRVPSWQKPLPSHGRLIAYDFNVNPEYPQFAPRARGLIGIPDGWNLDKQIDEEFRIGFRKVDFRRRVFN